MSDFVINIFPSGYLSHSVIIPVWVGVIVISLFNLRFGWVYSGLIVSGYLTPLLIIKPLSVVAIVIESVVTYIIIYFISEFAGRVGLWTNFFGRDRFFAILLVSVFVRIFFDEYFFPILDQFFIEHYNFSINYNDSLHSFGLIIVALIANQLFKPGLINGLLQLFITTLITFLIVKYIFIEHTNFSMSSIIYMYEDISASILSSPKSYIILLVTAFIASRMNLFYGWDYNGILVPSLLALEWTQPIKIFVSFLEAYIIYIMGAIALKLPIFKNASIEGARKTLLFFNLGLLYKIILSIVILKYFPDYKISDYFAFGYILSTLMAIKMYDKVHPILFTRATIQTSIISIVVATLIGYILVYISYETSKQNINLTVNKYLIKEIDTPLINFLEKLEMERYTQTDILNPYKPTLIEQLAWDNILSIIDKGYKRDILRLEILLDILNYNLFIIQNRYLILKPNSKNFNPGVYIWDMRAKNRDTLIELPYPTNGIYMIESAIALQKALNIEALAISGIEKKDTIHPTTPQANRHGSLFNLFHKHYQKRGILQIRDTKNNSKAFIKRYLPDGINLRYLQEHIKNLQLNWHPSRSYSIQKNSALGGFVELFLNKRDRVNLVSNILSTSSIKIYKDNLSIEELLESWLSSGTIDIAPKNSNFYKKPLLKELLFMDRNIISPIIQIIKSLKDKQLNIDNLKDSLHTIDISANILGYSVILYEEKITKKRFLILYEIADKKRYWGTYIFNLSPSKAISIQVPRPQYESFTLEYGAKLFEMINGYALLISGANPMANSDRSSDILLPSNRVNIFNLISQVIYRESGKDSMNVLQIRGKSSISSLQNSSFNKAVLAYNNGLNKSADINSMQKYLRDFLKKSLPLTIYDGSKDSVGYSADMFQSLYLYESLNDTFNVLWLPYNIRYKYYTLTDPTKFIHQFSSFGFDIIKMDLKEFIDSRGVSRECIKSDTIRRLKQYLSSRDIIELINLKRDNKLEILLTKSQKVYIAIEDIHSRVKLLTKIYTTAPFLVESLKDIDRDLKLFPFNQNTILKMDRECEE